MNNTIFLSIRVPEIPYTRVPVENVDLVESAVAINRLREEAAEKANLKLNEIVLVYKGRVIEEGSKMEEHGIMNGVTVHVMKKKLSSEAKKVEVLETNNNNNNGESKISSGPLTDEKIKQITFMFRHLTTSHLWKLTHPEVLVNVLEKYPAIRDDLGALAILRDPILLSSMKTPENLLQISKQYSILVDAASFIANTLFSLDQTQVNMPDFEDSDSSSSTSSSEDLTNGAAASSANNNDAARDDPAAGSSSSSDGRPITRQQLATALAMASAASRNSLSNIAQRNYDQSQSNDTMAMDTTGPSTINTSMLNEALNQAMVGADPASNNPLQASLSEQYARELAQMREMGLTDEQVNLQALQISGGDVEAAINLVFSSAI